MRPPCSNTQGNRLPWETGEGLIEKGRFHECLNLLPPSPPFWRQCFPTFGGLGTLGNYFPSPSISVRSQSCHLGKSRQNPTEGLFGFIWLFCFWNSRCLGCTCQYLHLPCPDIANGLGSPFPLVPESFSPHFLLWYNTCSIKCIILPFFSVHFGGIKYVCIVVQPSPPWISRTLPLAKTEALYLLNSNAFFLPSKNPF